MSPSGVLAEPPRPVAAAPARTRKPAGAGWVIPLERLAEAFGAVHRVCPELPVLAIRWLHLHHPLHPIQEALLRGEGWSEQAQAPQPRGAGIMIRLGKCLGYAALLSARLLMMRLWLQRAMAALSRRSFSVIARTWGYAGEPPCDGRDFYFGDLQGRLARRGLPVLMVCGDVLDGSWRAFASAHLDTGTFARLPELCLIHPLAPWRMAVKQLVSAQRLSRLASRADDPLMRQILRLASRACLAPDTASMGLTAFAADAAVRRWRPRACLTLYEGYAYERCVCLGVKSADSACRTIGYQHGMLFRESLSLTSPAVETHPGARPDIILSLGRIPQLMLQASHDGATQVLSFGSFRSQPEPAKEPADPRRRVVLVTPQGTASEVRALFGFAARCARRLPAYTFVLRCHPQLPLHEALLLLPKELISQPNIQLSEGPSIEAEFMRASILLYRGSSSVLYGILHGVLPIYLQLAGQPDRDPVYALEAWRRRCSAVEEFVALMAEHEQAGPERLRADWAAATHYAQTSVHPVEEAAIDALVGALGPGGPPARSRGEGRR